MAQPPNDFQVTARPLTWRRKLWDYRLYWALPVVLTLAVLLLIVWLGASKATPFLYTLF